jgi:PAS domain S-box-containing protein
VETRSANKGLDGAIPVKDQTLAQKDDIIYALLDLSPSPIAVIRIEDGRFMLVNQRYSEIAGYSPNQIIGQTPQALDIDVEVAELGRLMESLQHHGRLVRFETRFKTRNKRLLDTQLSARQIIFDNQACLLILITDFEEPQIKQEKRPSKTEKRYQNILDSITESYYEIDLSGRFTFFSEAVMDLFGYPADQLMGMSYQDYTTPENQKIAFEAFFKVYQEIVPYAIAEYSIIRGDGTVAHLEVSASLLRDEAGNPIGFYGINRDRTEQKKVEEALRRSEEKYRKILEDMEEGYYEMNLNGALTDFNAATCRLHGYGADELKGLSYKTYLLPEQVKTSREMYAQVYQTGLPGRVNDVPIIRKDGTLRYIEASAYQLKNDQGEIVGFWGISRDRTKQKLAEMALEKSEEKYRRILEGMDEGYYELDLKGHFTDFNAAACRLYGYPAEELKGLSYQKYLPPEQNEYQKKIFTQLYETGKPARINDIAVINKDGTTRYLEASAYILKNEAGETIGFWGIARDRTVQKLAEMALKASEEKYRRILEDMEEGYYENDLNGNFTYFNKAIIKIHGYSAEELMGMSYRAYLSPEQAEKNLKIFLGVYKNGAPAFIRDYEIIKKDGTISYSEISAYPLKDHNGKTIGFWGITRDRTEQRRAEIALRKSEEQYRLLVDHANDGIYITQEGRIKFHNPKTHQITGYAHEALLEMTFANLVHPEDRQKIYEAQQHKIELGQTPEVFTFRILNKANKIVWVELNAVGIHWEGRPATLNFLRDVTQFKKTEARLQQSQKMEAIGTLAGGIAHDFNNILYAMSGFTELALDDAPKDTLLKENLLEVISAGKRAKDLVRQILAFARQSEEKVEPVIVSTIAKEALKLIRSTTPSTIEMQTNIESNAQIMGNPTQVHQIVMNLCTNAAHAMENAGGVLSVDLVDTTVHDGDAETQLNLEPGHYIRLCVSDTGCGIAPENLNTIFEPYFTTKSLGEGTGMGLSVVQGIVESYGGKISVQSALGKGAAFTVLLPTTTRQSETTIAASETASSGSGRILFVDDEIMITRMGGQALERQGYKVLCQNSSLAALELFRSRPDDFDLVITDMTMPKMTGDQLAKEMLYIRPDIPIVMCTGYSKKINEDDTIKLGIKAFIYKPIGNNELADTIRRILDMERGK